MKCLKALLGALVVSATTAFASTNAISYDWKALPELPAPAEGVKQNGVAAPFNALLAFGEKKDLSYVIVAGGANFSEKPLVEGGSKQFKREIYKLKIISTNPQEKEYEWELADVSIPQNLPTTHGSTVVLDGETLLCIGGETDGATAKNDVFSIKVNKDGKIELKETAEVTLAGATYSIPNLPFTLSQGGALKLGDTIFVFGGKQDGKPSNKMYSLKLAAPTEGTELKWEESLALPGVGRVQPVFAIQKGGLKDRAKFFVFGGYSVNEQEIAYALTDGYAYLPAKGIEAARWEKVADIKPFGTETEVSVIGAVAQPAGVHSILVFGGFDKTVWDEWGKTWHQAKKTPEANAVKTAYFKQSAEKFGFSRKILSYNTVTDTWVVANEMPAEFSGNCGAAVLKDALEFLVISGEIKPGVRTAEAKRLKMNHSPSFGIANWAVLVAYLLGMVGLGVFFMKRENGAEDFMKGGGRIPWWAAGVSIFATMLSSLSFMSIPSMTYLSDWRVFFGAITIAMCVPIVTKIYLPFFRRLKVTSAYEYLEVRFNVWTRSIASFVFMFYMVARIGIVLYLPSVALNAVTGIDIMTCIVVIGAITIVYCTMGGIEAVVWGDFVQGLVLILGAVVAFIWLLIDTAGNPVEIAMQADKLKTFDFAFDISGPTFWVMLVGGMFTNVVQYTSDQSVVQRYLTTSDEAGARKSLWLNGILSIPVSFVFYGIGSALYTYYKTHPNELNVVMEQADQIFPHFMMAKLPAGLAGLLIAAVFSATMSTLSSNINSAATAYTTDFYKRFFNKQADDHQALKVCRIATVIVGIIGIGLAIYVNSLKSQEIFNFFNLVAGLMLSGLGAFFAMGILTKYVSGKGALLGFIGNVLVLLWLQKYSGIAIFGWFYAFIGMTTTFVLSLIFSAILPDKKDIKGLTIYDLKDMKEED